MDFKLTCILKITLKQIHLLLISISCILSIITAGLEIHHLSMYFFLVAVIVTFFFTLPNSIAIENHVNASVVNQEVVGMTDTPQGGFSFTNESYDFYRPAPPSYIEGTINWQKLSPSTGSPTFSPRHSHATCVFKCPNTNSNETNDDGKETKTKTKPKQCIWLTGGRTEPYRTFDLRMEDRKADIWWSEDGANWNQVTEVYGDFLQGVGNSNAKVGGEVAPWFSRYGHSMDAVDTDGDGINDVMVLMGGFNPLPSNDIWISPNGTTWFFEQYARWSGRSYHATSIFKNRLLVAGGSPLSNEVWSGYVVKDSSQRSGYRIGWKELVQDGKAPWAPRYVKYLSNEKLALMVHVGTKAMISRIILRMSLISFKCSNSYCKILL